MWYTTCKHARQPRLNGPTPRRTSARVSRATVQRAATMPAQRTRLDSVSAECPVFDDTETTAEHHVSCSTRWSRTIRTIRFRRSGEQPGEIFIAPVSQELGSPENPARSGLLLAFSSGHQTGRVPHSQERTLPT